VDCQYSKYLESPYRLWTYFYVRKALTSDASYGILAVWTITIIARKPPPRAAYNLICPLTFA